ncbi:hypothetical protein K491DRAFT_697670 [Lophiostoma macrostomum CBS 122681]|uniref:Uncharacterized protein n=1 Tax=Lophiostoma macrostomum CBS 122681 TaxID=1314788 RepID=A0A6A6SQ24_9PLEO|nr:hypothetical protein K491DRAFT_697670 [Lophiostoma macrostomum CBS 122681]
MLESTTETTSLTLSPCESQRIYRDPNRRCPRKAIIFSPENNWWYCNWCASHERVGADQQCQKEGSQPDRQGESRRREQGTTQLAIPGELEPDHQEETKCDSASNRIFDIQFTPWNQQFVCTRHARRCRAFVYPPCGRDFPQKYPVYGCARAGTTLIGYDLWYCAEHTARQKEARTIEACDTLREQRRKHKAQFSRWSLPSKFEWVNVDEPTRIFLACRKMISYDPIQ